MKKIITLLLTAISISIPAVAQVGIEGSESVNVDVPQSLGYTKVYVLRHTAGVTLSYASSAKVTGVERFSSLGAAYAEAIPFTYDGSRAVFDAESGDMGYRVTMSGGSMAYFWVVDYDKHLWDVRSLSVMEADSDCGRVALAVEGKADAITVYGISGRPFTLDRDIKLEYHTLVYDSSAEAYNETQATETLSELHAIISAPAPLCNTAFVLQPDRFARQWHIGSALETATYTAIAVDAQTTAEQAVETFDNEQKTESGGEMLGGSAPCEITFKAVVSDAAIFRRWEISRTPEFEDPFYTFNDLEFSYNFTEAGASYVRFTANNAAGTCEYLGETYTVGIGESSLLCPNAFSPGASEGVNDEWKVSYRSIIEFDCQIFNRWGKRLATLTHPSQGWDGIVGGKPVSSGVYFYVIKAKGSDGKEYKLAGDINVINSRKNTDLPSSSEE